MKKQFVAVTVVLLVLLSMTAFAAPSGRYDQQIQQAVSQKMHGTKQLQSVNSSVEDGIVTLSGTVNLYQDKLNAAKKAKKIANVTGVRNTIEVAGANVADGQLEQKLAKKLAFDRVGYFDNTFNYLALNVQNGVVTLEGDMVYDTPKDSAMAIVAGTPGVKDVVDNVKVLRDGFVWAEKYFAAKPEAPLGHGFVKDGIGHLDSLEKSLSAGDFDGANDGLRGVVKSCKACHEAYKPPEL